MIVDDGGCGYADRKFPCVEKKLPFAVRHPIFCGLGTIFFGIIVMAGIDFIFFKIGGMKLVERLGIVPVAIGVLFFLKGYFQMFYPSRY